MQEALEKSYWVHLQGQNGVSTVLLSHLQKEKNMMKSVLSQKLSNK